MRRRALVEQSRGKLPRLACGERVGVRGVLATAQHPDGPKAPPSPGSRARRGCRPLPRKRGEVIVGAIESIHRLARGDYIRRLSQRDTSNRKRHVILKSLRLVHVLRSGRMNSSCGERSDGCDPPAALRNETAAKDDTSSSSRVSCWQIHGPEPQTFAITPKGALADDQPSGGLVWNRAVISFHRHSLRQI